MELGCKLVKELELESGTNTLGRWMAHNLAELLQRAEHASGKEKEALQRECADLIIKLWTCRASLPTAHRPLQSFESIMKAIEYLRCDTPAYFRDFRDNQDKRVSEDVEKWLDIAVKIDSIARELVGSCVQFAVTNAANEEREWLMTGLILSSDNDQGAKVVVKLLEQYQTEQKESKTRPEELAMRRFQEFGEICSQIADQMRSLLSTPSD